MQKEELRDLVSHLTALGSRVVWDGDDVRSIAMFGNRVTDRDLGMLRQLPGLREINLTKTEVSDAGLFHVGKIDRLEVLFLGRTAVTDEGLEFISSLKHLTQLNLSLTAVSDQGIALVARLTQLECLWLEGADVTDTGTELLADLKSLKLLDLCRTTVTDATLAHLRGLSELEELNLAGCQQITGDGLAELTGRSQLDWLGLDSTSVDDTSLKHLVNLPLTSLSLNWTGITELGLAHLREMPLLSELRILGAAIDQDCIDRFRDARPGCRVLHSSGPSDGAIVSSNI